MGLHKNLEIKNILMGTSQLIERYLFDLKKKRRKFEILKKL